MNLKLRIEVSPHRDESLCYNLSSFLRYRLTVLPSLASSPSRSVSVITIALSGIQSSETS